MLKGSGTFTDDDLFRLGVLLYIHLQHLHGGSRAWPGEAAVTLYPRSVARAYSYRTHVRQPGLLHSVAPLKVYFKKSNQINRLCLTSACLPNSPSAICW